MSTPKIALTVSIAQLASIKGASGKIVKNGDGKSIGMLDLETGHGSIAISLDDFDALYRGFVNCWPEVKPIKDKLVQARRDEVKAEKEATREAAKAEKVAEAAKKKAEREAAAAKVKADKEAEAAKVKADKAAKVAKELADKKKADAEKLKKAAADKTKKDAEKAKADAAAK